MNTHTATRFLGMAAATAAGIGIGLGAWAQPPQGPGPDAPPPGGDRLAPRHLPPGPPLPMHLLDTDGDGQLTLDEATQPIPAFDDRIFTMLDQDGDGTLTLAEVAAPPRGPQGPPPGEDGHAGPRRGGPRAGGPDAQGPEGRPRTGRPGGPEPRREGRGPQAGEGPERDRPMGPPPGAQRRGPEERFKNADANQDGIVDKQEAATPIPLMDAAQFQRLDKDGDGVVTRAELPAPPRRHLEFRGEDGSGKPGRGDRPERRRPNPEF